MTKYKKYCAGENYFKWEVKLVIYQKDDEYKFVLADDEDNIYIASDYVSLPLSEQIEKTIDVIMNSAISAQFESLLDIYNILQNTFYGQFFYWGEKIAPQLTDGVLLLSLSE